MNGTNRNDAIAARPALAMRRDAKIKHILQIMEDLMESGVGGPTALHIADRAGYRHNGKFMAFLWDMVDAGHIRADCRPYKSGICLVRWHFYLPEVFSTKQAIQKMRDRDRHERT